MSLKHSLEHFANGTGCMQLQWPQDKENRKEGKRGGNPPEALLAYGSSEERQAALDQNQQRPGEWGFYAAAAKGAKESKDRKNNRNVAEGDEQVAYHREAFSELQPPQVGRGGLLGDAPSDWGYCTEVQPQNLVWTNEEVNCWQQQWAQGNSFGSTNGQWPANNTGNGDDWAQSLYIDPVEQQPVQQQTTNAVLQPAGQTAQLPPQLPPVEDLVRNLDFLDHEDEAEYRSPVMCLPTGLVGSADGPDEVPYLRSVTAPATLDMDDCFMPAESTPPRMRRAHTYTHATPPRPTTPGSAGHAAVYHQVHPGLPCRHTFIHFDNTEPSASIRSRSCPADCRAVIEEPELQRASTLDVAPPMWAHDDAIIMSSDMPMHMAQSPVRHRMLETIETPQRVQGFALGEEHTPAPRQGPPRARRGGRGRHGKGPNSHNKIGHGLSGSWRPTLWTEGH